MASATEAAAVFLAGGATALATGLGAVPVFLMGTSARAAQPFLSGVAIGAMAVASIAGLLLPALREGSTAAVIAAVITGCVFVGVARAGLSHERAHFGVAARRSILVFAVLFVHSLPEGFAVGAAWASTAAGLSTFVVLAIALQNIPEGTAVAVPMQEAGYRPRRQVATAIASSAPQPVGALIAFLLVEEVSALLPVSLAFAGGAMGAVVVLELVPSAARQDWRSGLAGAVIGTAVMAALGAAIGV